MFIYHSLFVPSPWRLSYNEADTNEAAGASQPKGTSHGKNGENLGEILCFLMFFVDIFGNCNGK
jgi:hypothetical protein